MHGKTNRHRCHIFLFHFFFCIVLQITIYPTILEGYVIISMEQCPFATILLFIETMSKGEGEEEEEEETACTNKNMQPIMPLALYTATFVFLV